MASSPIPADSNPLGFQPNFSCKYSVLLDQPISSVFPIIATTEGCESVTRLSKLCTAFELGKRDDVAVPRSASLRDSHFRTVPAHETTEGQKDIHVLPRQSFKMTETIPILFGIIRQNVILSGTLTWDEPAGLALYETITDGGIQVHKLREIEAVEGGKTRVTEVIHGKCPSWLRLIVERAASHGHKAHMDLYHTLFQ
ncbi:hypothetical protein BD779DRAFT_1495965 [Infundibulicybe gibba]|nr:hypothetical protein BD779DRAFT_1495965 [Infundibulicybe gibba]